MKRPYYLHTPRNYLGESLVGQGANYQIRWTVDVGSKKREVFAEGKNFKMMTDMTKKLNDCHETDLAFAMYI